MQHKNWTITVSNNLGTITSKNDGNVNVKRCGFGDLLNK